MEFTLILAQALVILAFLALLLAVLVFVRRAARFLAETRDIERFRRAVADITGRAIGSLDSVTGQIDGLRRRTVAAEAIVDALGTSREALTHYADESRALRGPATARTIRDDLVTELERAARALQMVEHGCDILTAARSEVRAPGAETSIKRGYLNLIHAREAIVRHGARASELSVGEPWRLFQPPSA